MKIAVYAISKNESKFVQRWVDSMSEADAVYVCDTGSTDDTVSQLRDRGVVVNEIFLGDWRFDIARNISLSFVPDDVDVCVCTDLDEILEPGWRQHVEAAFADLSITRMKYWYTWNFLPDGKPGTQFWYDKVHLRHGYQWIHPVHEVLKYYNGPESYAFNDKMRLNHYPDPSKSRSSYLHLLEQSVKEDPNDDRNMHYLGREYTFYNQWEKAIDTLKRHLQLPSATWAAERATSMRLIAKSYAMLHDIPNAHHWYKMATIEDPTLREAWYDLALAMQQSGQHLDAYYAAKKGLEIHDMNGTYIHDPAAWSGLLEDICAVSSWYLGLKRESLKYTSLAVVKCSDERVLKNYHFITTACGVQNDTN